MTDTISLHWVDWTIIIAYILFSLGVGIYFSKYVLKKSVQKRGSSIRDFKNVLGNTGNFQREF